MPQLPQRLGFDLAYALARDVELLADFFQRVVGRHLDAEAHAQHLRLARRERIENFLRDVPQAGKGGRVGRRKRRLVLDEIAEMRVVVVADRRLHGDRLLGDFQNLPDFLLGHLHPLRQRRRVGLLPGLLQDLARDAVHLVDRLDHVHRDANGACLIGDRARDGLPDPPRRVGREFVAAPVLELVDRLHQADVPLLDEVEELQAAVGVLLGDRNHEAQVGLRHFALRAARLGLAGRHLLVDLFQIAQRDADLLLHGGHLREQLEDRRLHPHERLAPRLGAVDLGRQPALGGLRTCEHLDEVRAWHLRLLDRDVMDRALVAPDLVDQAAHAVRQALDRARRKADRHQLVRDLVANTEVVLVLGALVLQRLEQLLEQPADAREFLQRLAFELEQARGLCRLGGFLVLLAFFLLDLRFLVLGRLGALRIEVFLGVRIDQAIDHLVDAHLILLDLVREVEDLRHRGRAGADRQDHVPQAVLDALGDLDFAFARQQLDRAHLAHVHAHRVGGAPEFRVDRRERRFGLLFHILVRLGDGLSFGSDQQLLLVGRLVVDLDAHVGASREARLDLLGVDQVLGQVVVDFRIREEAALLAELDQVLQPIAPGLGILFRHLRRDEPLVLAAAPAALALDLDLGDLGLEELERLLGALDRRLRALRLVFGLAGERLGRSALRYHGREATRPLNVLAQRLLGRTRLRDVTLHGADEPRLFLCCLDFLHLRFALRLRHWSPDLKTSCRPRKKEPRIIVDHSRAWKCPRRAPGALVHLRFFCGPGSSPGTRCAPPSTVIRLPEGDRALACGAPNPGLPRPAGTRRRPLRARKPTLPRIYGLPRSNQAMDRPADGQPGAPPTVRSQIPDRRPEQQLQRLTPAGSGAAGRRQHAQQATGREGGCRATCIPGSEGRRNSSVPAPGVRIACLEQAVQASLGYRRPAAGGPAPQPRWRSAAEAVGPLFSGHAASLPKQTGLGPPASPSRTPRAVVTTGTG